MTGIGRRGAIVAAAILVAACLPLASAVAESPFLAAPGPGSPQPTAAAPNPRSPPPAGAAEVNGTVTRAADAATLIIGDKPVRLWGVDPGPASVLPPFETWLRQTAGILTCEPVAQTGRYKCVTQTGHDVAEVALLSGFALVGAGALTDYRRLEDQAREQHHGLWQQP